MASTQITAKEIEKLAELSRIRLTPEEVERMRTEISSILSYVDQLKSMTEGGSRNGDTGAAQGLHNVLREDEAAHPSGAHTDAILATVPRTEGNYVKVKKILASSQ